MPNIREYNSSESLQGIRPNEAGPEALARSGRIISDYSNQAGHDIGQAVSNIGPIADEVKARIDQHDAMQEISTGAAAMSNLTSKLTDQWNQTANSSDLNDHSIADKFRTDSLEPALEQWQQGFTTKAGQKWALERADALRNHFFEKTSADMATRAGDALVSNLNTTLNASSNMARNDPSSMAFAMDQYESGLRASVANSNADPRVASKVLTEQLEKGKSQIAMSAGIGMAEKNPDALDAAVNGHTFDKYLHADKQKQLQGFAQTQRTHMKTQATEVSQDQKNQFLTNLVDPNTNQVKQITPDLIGKALTNPLMKEQEKTSLVDFLKGMAKSQAEGVKESDPQVVSNLRQRLASGDPSQYPTDRELGVAMASGKVSDKDATDIQKIQKLVKGETKDPQAAVLFKDGQRIGQNYVLGAGNAPGQASVSDLNRLQRFTSWYQNAFTEGLKSHAAQQLLTPGSPDYLLKPENLQYFKTNGDDLVKGAPQGSVGVALMPPGAQQQKPVMVAPQQRKPLGTYFGAISGTQ